MTGYCVCTLFSCKNRQMPYKYCIHFAKRSWLTVISFCADRSQIWRKRQTLCWAGNAKLAVFAGYDDKGVEQLWMESPDALRAHRCAQVMKKYILLSWKMTISMKLDLNFYARDTKSMKIIMNLRDMYCFNWLLKFQ